MRKVILFFIFLSLLLGSVRLAYDYIRVFTTEKQWLMYSDSQKRRELYGDIYDVIQSVETEHKNVNNILLISGDGKQFFILRYILYPKKVYWDRLENNIDLSQYDLIINYHPSETKMFHSEEFFNKLNATRKSSEIRENNTIVAEIYS